MDKNKISMDYYNNRAFKYNKIWNQPIQKFHHEMENKIIKNYLNEKNKIAVIGCGGGREFSYMSGLDADITGFDFSKKMLKESEAYINKLKKSEKIGNVKLVRGNASALPFKNNYFDMIICLGAINYFLDYEKSISEMSRVLKHDGIIVVSAINKFQFSEIINGRRIRQKINLFLDNFRRKNNKKPFRKLFDTKELTYLYRNNSLEPIEIQGIRLFHDILPNKLNNEEKYHKITNKFLNIINRLEIFLMKANFFKNFARYIVIIGKKRIKI
jgi:ubiquinone/menaquinone biosynthesis C-methylase UbiE